MGKKYLDTKKNTLEASILDVWKEAAKLNEYKTKLGEKRRVAGGDMRRTENKKFKESTLQGDEIGEATGKEIAAKMMKDKSMKAFASKVAKMKTVSRDDLEKMLPDFVAGAAITKLFEEKHEYEKFFNAAMKKFKIKSPADLKSDEEKKKFFDYVDKNYKSSAEKKTGKEDPTEKDKEKIGEKLQKQYEFKMQSMKDAVQKVWEVSDMKKAWESSDREKIETKRARSVQARPGKTMTGDAASVVTINPKVKD